MLLVIVGIIDAGILEIWTESDDGDVNVDEEADDEVDDDNDNEVNDD